MKEYAIAGRWYCAFSPTTSPSHGLPAHPSRLQAVSLSIRWTTPIYICPSPRASRSMAYGGTHVMPSVLRPRPRYTRGFLPQEISCSARLPSCLWQSIYSLAPSLLATFMSNFTKNSTRLWPHRFFLAPASPSPSPH